MKLPATTGMASFHAGWGEAGPGLKPIAVDVRDERLRTQDLDRKSAASASASG